MFEKYIQDHRKAFDKGPVPEGHKARFEQRLKQEKKAEPSITIPLRRIYQVAAAMLVILIAVQGGKYFFSAQGHAGLEPSEKVMAELSDMDMYYGQMVRQEISQLKKESWEQYDFITSLKDELNILETEYEALKESILQEGRNQYLIEAMIQNYQQRINILKTISKTIKQTKTDHESEIIQSS
jgi:hypothetical protein